ncbi:MAG TPA: MaoC family dehydratase [Solirubrobacteraceae bacterium]|jgi:acyl dehydratase|nr:MaoC family dehydratase [Solirubrobacteraceae bacterium]
MPETDAPHPSSAPFFEDLFVGRHERSAPSVTLTEGMAAVHQAILGDRLRLALDRKLAREVLGLRAPLAHPALVWDVAIGQSTLLTGRVIANLFYRGLVLQRAPVIGDTLSTSTEVVGLRQTTSRPGRPASGLAALRVRTTDQDARPVLDFWRCAMLPLRDPHGCSGRADSFDDIPAELPADALRAAVSTWRLDALPGAGRERPAQLSAGARWSPHGGDVVSSAPELARLTLNVAAVHHDRHAQPGGRRLVYGGHTIGLAAAQATRALPEIVTIVGWHSCEHLAPVHEGDTLRSELELERLEELPNGGALAHLRSRVAARGDGDPVDVLDWRFVAVLA